MSVLLLAAISARAQSVSVSSPVYRPGRYLPLRIEADAPGVVRVRGDGVQGVVWPAPGRGSVVVPLLVYDAVDGLSLTVNGKPVRLDPNALHDGDPVPTELFSFWHEVDPQSTAGPAFDDDAYQAVALWRPGRDAAVRRWTLIALAVAVLVLGVAVHADPRRGTLWLIVVGVGLCLGFSTLYPDDAPRRVLPAEGRANAEWFWAAAVDPRMVDEPWTPGLRFVPRSAEQLKSADPTLSCDARGRPVRIRVAIGRDGRAVFSRPRVSSSPPTP